LKPLTTVWLPKVSQPFALFEAEGARDRPGDRIGINEQHPFASDSHGLRNFEGEGRTILAVVNARAQQDALAAPLWRIAQLHPQRLG
ncbi:MAG TPA: hypothetical protein DCL48_13145, partial [Alphaproteobacteria bacterium]|nr:hypothetical protein [Alphaproteobacteria bacterium]